jgi:predicted RNase H-related nuclease YkuK (DUF458 family)
MHDFKQANKALVNERMVYEVGKSEGCIRYSTVTGFIRHPLEIHADIKRPKWESNKALQQTIGYILGMGYQFKIKPDAYAASSGLTDFVKKKT